MQQVSTKWVATRSSLSESSRKVPGGAGWARSVTGLSLEWRTILQSSAADPE
jgi:hypothetical protein